MVSWQLLSVFLSTVASICALQNKTNKRVMLKGYSTIEEPVIEIGCF